MKPWFTGREGQDILVVNLIFYLLLHKYDENAKSSPLNNRASLPNPFVTQMSKPLKFCYRQKQSYQKPYLSAPFQKLSVMGSKVK